MESCKRLPMRDFNSYYLPEITKLCPYQVIKPSLYISAISSVLELMLRFEPYKANKISPTIYETLRKNREELLGWNPGMVEVINYVFNLIKNIVDVKSFPLVTRKKYLKEYLTQDSTANTLEYFFRMLMMLKVDQASKNKIETGTLDLDLVKAVIGATSREYQINVVLLVEPDQLEYFNSSAEKARAYFIVKNSLEVNQLYTDEMIALEDKTENNTEISENLIGFKMQELNTGKCSSLESQPFGAFYSTGNNYLPYNEIPNTKIENKIITQNYNTVIPRIENPAPNLYSTIPTNLGNGTGLNYNQIIPQNLAPNQKNPLALPNATQTNFSKVISQIPENSNPKFSNNMMTGDVIYPGFSTYNTVNENLIEPQSLNQNGPKFNHTPNPFSEISKIKADPTPSQDWNQIKPNFSQTPGPGPEYSPNMNQPLMSPPNLHGWNQGTPSHNNTPVPNSGIIPRFQPSNESPSPQTCYQNNYKFNADPMSNPNLREQSKMQNWNQNIPDLNQNLTPNQVIPPKSNEHLINPLSTQSLYQTNPLPNQASNISPAYEPQKPNPWYETQPAPLPTSNMNSYPKTPQWEQGKPPANQTPFIHPFQQVHPESLASPKISDYSQPKAAEVPNKLPKVITDLLLKIAEVFSEKSIFNPEIQKMVENAWQMYPEIGDITKGLICDIKSEAPRTKPILPFNPPKDANVKFIRPASPSPVYKNPPIINSPYIPEKPKIIQGPQENLRNDFQTGQKLNAFDTNQIGKMKCLMHNDFEKKESFAEISCLECKNYICTNCRLLDLKNCVKCKREYSGFEVELIKVLKLSSGNDGDNYSQSKVPQKTSGYFQPTPEYGITPNKGYSPANQGYKSNLGYVQNYQTFNQGKTKMCEMHFQNESEDLFSYEIVCPDKCSVCNKCRVQNLKNCPNCYREYSEYETALLSILLIGN